MDRLRLAQRGIAIGLIITILIAVVGCTEKREPKPIQSDFELYALVDSGDLR